MDLNQYDVAYDCLMYATTLEPANAENWLSVGNLYLQKGQAADAITAYEHAVHLNPMSEAWYELGKVRHSVVYSSSSSIDAQMLSAAIQAYTQALSICPTKRDDISLKLQHLRALVDSLPTPSDTPAAAAPAEEATRRADALAAPLPPSTVLPPPGTLLSAAPAPGAPAPGLMAESQGGQLTREPAAAAEAMGSTSTSPLAAAETAAVEPPLAVSETSTMAGVQALAALAPAAGGLAAVAPVAAPRLAEPRDSSGERVLPPPADAGSADASSATGASAVHRGQKRARDEADDAGQAVAAKVVADAIGGAQLASDGQMQPAAAEAASVASSGSGAAGAAVE